uniref:Uncharacterized protein n=1 Tax=Panagrellus redivivus TaxID=6233 RepID=A0A7E4V0E1_PANRE
MSANPSDDTTAFLRFTAEESHQFSLDDEPNDPTATEHQQQRQNLLGNGAHHASHNPPKLNGTTINTAPSNTSTTHNQSTNQTRFPTWRNTSKFSTNNIDTGEASRLTDEIELDDADSGSDDLDLLPPFTHANGNTSNSSTATKTVKRKLYKVFRCCSPHFVRPSCSIM